MAIAATRTLIYVSEMPSSSGTEVGEWLITTINKANEGFIRKERGKYGQLPHFPRPDPSNPTVFNSVKVTRGIMLPKKAPVPVSDGCRGSLFVRSFSLIHLYYLLMQLRLPAAAGRAFSCFDSGPAGPFPAVLANLSFSIG